MWASKATAVVSSTVLAISVASAGPAAAANSMRQDNLSRVHREAHRLVDLIVLPDGSTEQHASAELHYPRYGAALFRVRQAWQVPLGMDAAQDWLADNAPANLTPKNSGPVPGAAGTFESRFLDPEPSSAWLGRAHLIVRIASTQDDGTTKWTISGQAIPLSNGAGRDSNEGYPLAVRPSEGCPSHERGISHVADGVAGPSGHFVPAGRVTAAVVCRYNGDRQLRPSKPRKRLELRSSHRLDRGAAKRLATLGHEVSVHSITSYPPPGGIPPDYSATVLALHYASGRDVDVRVTREDLGYTLSNGTIEMVSWLYGPGMFRFMNAVERAARNQH